MKLNILIGEEVSIQRYEDEIALLKQMNASLDQQVANKDNHIENLRTTEKELSSELQARIGQIEEEKENRERRENEMSSELQARIREIQEEKENREKREIEIEKLKKELMKGKEEYEALHEAFESSQKKNEDLLARYEVNEIATRKLENNLNAFKTREQNLQAIIKEVQSKNEELMKQNTVYQARIADLSKDIEELENKAREELLDRKKGNEQLQHLQIRRKSLERFSRNCKKISNIYRAW